MIKNADASEFEKLQIKLHYSDNSQYLSVCISSILLEGLCFPASDSGVCKMYEEHLKRMNPNSPSITYDISQLFDFIDDLADLSCLV